RVAAIFNGLCPNDDAVLDQEPLKTRVQKGRQLCAKVFCLDRFFVVKDTSRLALRRGLVLLFLSLLARRRDSYRFLKLSLYRQSGREYFFHVTFPDLLLEQ